ncbi:DUF6634 family protein [Rhizobium sp. 18055]|uniref:DUF6634 family protein n=1 Tax=Rhizobium sp. 18055 TaxID=2681403 RepID=UPI0027BAB1F9|nr:DUF6634 family protein [Rhizobium sp. 18055]
MGESLEGRWFGSSQIEIVTKLRGLTDDLANIGCFNWQQPTAVHITDWFVGRRAVPCLIGRTIGHPNISDGQPMFSTELFYLDVDAGYARTFSRWYRLGRPMDSGKRSQNESALR